MIQIYDEQSYSFANELFVEICYVLVYYESLCHYQNMTCIPVCYKSLYLVLLWVGNIPCF